jgi:hypothetical protein
VEFEVANVPPRVEFARIGIDQQPVPPSLRLIRRRRRLE